MDLFLLILSAMLIISGIIGSFIPILPGPLTSWFGLFILNLIKQKIELGYQGLILLPEIGLTSEFEKKFESSGAQPSIIAIL